MPCVNRREKREHELRRSSCQKTKKLPKYSIRTLTLVLSVASQQTCACECVLPHDRFVRPKGVWSLNTARRIGDNVGSFSQVRTTASGVCVFLSVCAGRLLRLYTTVCISVLISPCCPCLYVSRNAICLSHCTRFPLLLCAPASVSRSAWIASVSLFVSVKLLLSLFPGF